MTQKSAGIVYANDDFEKSEEALGSYTNPLLSPLIGEDGYHAGSSSNSGPAHKSCCFGACEYRCGGKFPCCASCRPSSPKSRILSHLSFSIVFSLFLSVIGTVCLYEIITAQIDMTVAIDSPSASAYGTSFHYLLLESYTHPSARLADESLSLPLPLLLPLTSFLPLFQTTFSFSFSFPFPFPFSFSR